MTSAPAGKRVNRPVRPGVARKARAACWSVVINRAGAGMSLIYRTRGARARQLACGVGYNIDMTTPTPEATAPTAIRKYRLGMPFWIWIVLAAGAAVALIQFLVPDQGLANGFTWP